MQIENADSLRITLFVSSLLVLFAMQMLLPKRNWQIRTSWQRAFVNVFMVVAGTLAIRVCVPISLMSVANMQLHQFAFASLPVPYWLVVVASVVVLDCLIYWQHRLFHHVPWLWKVHRMHHSDTELGTTTGIRFHPLEFLLSYVLKLVAIVLLGVDALSVLLFEILLNASSLWNHSNIAVPSRFDGILRALIVTPDMHRVHHSVYSNEHNANYGFCLSIWDRIFSSYVAQPRDGHSNMKIGLQQFRQPHEQKIVNLFLQPLR